MAIKGFKDFERQLTRLQRKVKSLDGTHSVPVADLLKPDFVSANSNFPTFDAMMLTSPIKITCVEDFEREEWNAFIVANTRFSSWTEMVGQAGEQWLSQQLFKDV